MDTPGASPSSESRANDRAQNSIRPREPKRRPADRESNTPSGATAEANAVPPEIAKRFVQVKNKYYFPDGARAFTDRGNRLTTPSENTEVVRSLIGIAQARGWHDITLRGTERFRQEVWVQASLAGLQVRGYRPSEFEQERLLRTLAREKGGDAPALSPGADADSIARTSAGEEPARSSARTPRVERDALILGKLLDYRRAPYHHDPKAAMSYFVKLETPRGERVVWGVDLERAIQESVTKPKPGDEVGLRSLPRDAVKVKVPTRDEAGQVTGKVDRLRHRWIVERREFFEVRAAAARSIQDPAVKPSQAVRRHPELAGTYRAVHAAELVAQRMRNPDDRARFLAIVRAALAGSVARGEPLPALRVRDRAKTRAPDPREREVEPTRG